MAGLSSVAGFCMGISACEGVSVVFGAAFPVAIIQLMTVTNTRATARTIPLRLLLFFIIFQLLSE